MQNQLGKTLRLARPGWLLTLLPVLLLLPVFALASEPEEIQLPYFVDHEYDWLLNTSGEWIKGEALTLYQRDLEFKSRGLGTQFIPIKQIKYLRTSMIRSVNLQGRKPVVGRVELAGEVITVWPVTSPEPISAPLSDLLALAPAALRERDFWTGSIDFGANVRSGNTDKLEYNASTSMLRRTSSTRYLFDYIGQITTDKRRTTGNNQRVDTSLDVFLARNYYVTPVFGDYFRDPFKNIAWRFSLGSGVGWDIIRRPGLEWTLSPRLAYQWQRAEDAPSDGNSRNEENPSLILASLYNATLWPGAWLKIDYRGRYTSRTLGEYTHNALTSFNFKVLGDLGLRISFIWDYVKEPVPAEDGSRPKKSDLQFLLGVSYSL